MTAQVIDCDGDGVGKGNGHFVRHGGCGDPSHNEFSGASIKGISRTTWMQIGWVLLATLIFFDNSHSAEFEPRYRWVAPPATGTFDTQEEALAAYTAFEDAANLIRPGTAGDITVLGYELVGLPLQSYFLVNNRPNGYQFKYRTPVDCPNFCYGNGMSLQLECPSGTSMNFTNLGGGSLRYVCAENSPPAEPEPPPVPM